MSPQSHYYRVEQIINTCSSLLPSFICFWQMRLSPFLKTMWMLFPCQVIFWKETAHCIIQHVIFATNGRYKMYPERWTFKCHSRVTEIIEILWKRRLSERAQKNTSYMKSPHDDTHEMALHDRLPAYQIFLKKWTDSGVTASEGKSKLPISFYE